MTPRIYTNSITPSAEIPNLDLLTLLFDSEHTACHDEHKVVHVDSAAPDNHVTKSQLRELTQRIAHGIRTLYGIGARGPNRDVVTTITDGQILAPAIYFGIVAAGGVSSAASPSSTISELVRQFTTTQSQLIICDKEHKNVVCKAAKACEIPLDRVVVAQSAPKWSLVSVKGSKEVLSPQRLEWERITDPKKLDESLITILWSSGTTGLPKGVMISHRNLVAETYITAIPMRQWVAEETAKGAANLKLPENRALAHLPTSHIAGLFGCMITPFYNNGTVFWMQKYKWEEFLLNMKRYEITVLFTMPTIYLRIAKTPEAAAALTSVAAASAGGSAMAASLQADASTKFGGITIGQTWGLSESTGGCTGMPPGPPDTTGSIGVPLPGVEIRVVDDDYRDVEPGQDGELLIRSPTVTRGYYQNPEATKELFHDGWLCTGDIGVVRNEKIYIIDRKKVCYR
ncbi:hypothetical protein NPX13_g7655 [Xylaria arbuscula]|uniref:AMP-dependent synthetase/ligase domain-containing protein n=1 Tax=Xylaria arbuscula TaxID=114810 RepID=A0A9W8TJ19_9PEZI|nr:hypothetical protein NPX13_g7655 [Xylaria arbuscula]